MRQCRRELDWQQGFENWHSWSKGTCTPQLRVPVTFNPQVQRRGFDVLELVQGSPANDPQGSGEPLCTVQSLLSTLLCLRFVWRRLLLYSTHSTSLGLCWSLWSLPFCTTPSLLHSRLGLWWDLWKLPFCTTPSLHHSRLGLFWVLWRLPFCRAQSPFHSSLGLCFVMNSPQLGHPHPLTSCFFEINTGEAIRVGQDQHRRQSWYKGSRRHLHSKGCKLRNGQNRHLITQ